MNVFFTLFRCFAKTIILDNVSYYNIFNFIYNTNGLYIGIYNKDNAYEDVDTIAPEPDEIFCCCLCCCSSCFKHINDDTNIEKN
jgi:hypothetical protein